MKFLTMGILLGLSAGFSPGPLLTLVISETLRHGIRSGIKVALAPMVTDLPIILATLFILSKLSASSAVLGVVSLCGGLFVLYMGWESLRSHGTMPVVGDAAPKSLAKGIATNVLSPYPYLFWLSVGAPAMNKALALSVAAPVAFICGFYSMLVGSKIMLAVVVGKSRGFLAGPAYRCILRLLGLLLVVLAFVLMRDGLRLLGFPRG